MTHQTIIYDTIRAGLSFFLVASLHAQTPNWQVVLANANTGIQPAGLPTIVQLYAESETSGSSQWSARIQDSNISRLWVADSAVGARAIAQNGVLGALGPGRSGSEANDTFSIIWYEAYGTANDQHVFAAVAAGTTGLWWHNGVSNQEIARAGTDGNLGPQLGPGFTFRSNLGVGNAALGRIVLTTDQQLFLGSRLVSPDGDISAVFRRLPSSALTLCTREGSSDPAYAPGVFAVPSRFSNLGGLNVSSAGDAFILGTAQPTQVGIAVPEAGIWRVCAGAPQARMLTRRRDALGPNRSGLPRAEFSSISSPYPIGGNGYLVDVRYRSDAEVSASALIDALYLNDGIANQQLLAVGDSIATIGANVRSVGTFAGSGTAALVNTVRIASDGVDRAALWRVRGASTPELLAVQNLSQAPFAPSTTSQWANFVDSFGLENGDIIALANTRDTQSNTVSLGLWRFKSGLAPVRILGPGSPVQYRTLAGSVVTGTLQQLSALSSSQTPLYAGDDGWISPAGSVHLLGTLTGISGTVALQANLLKPSELFIDGFE
jgi:hypothetical protein